MKNIILIVVLFCSAVTIQAQDTQLFENDWYLEKIEISGEELFIPNNNDKSLAIVQFDTDFVNISYCDGYGLNVDGYSNVDFLVSGAAFLVLDDCEYEESGKFQGFYLSIFGEPSIENPLTFLYEINAINNYMQLIVTNEEGDRAYYNNIVLDVPSVQNIDVSIYPNPATSTIFVQSSKFIEQVNIYAINGQQVVLAKENISNIDVSKLKAGVYFVSITTGEGSLVKQFIKK